MASASGSNGGLTNEITYAIEAMKQLKVTDLKDICRSVGLPLSGRKVNLQDRIAQYIKDSMSIGHIDPWRPKTIVLIISKIISLQHIPPYIDIWADVKSGKYPTPIGQILGYDVMNIAKEARDNKMNTSASQVNDPHVKKSLNEAAPFTLTPFYNLQYQVSKSSYRLVKAAGRGVGAVRFTFTGHEWLKLQSDSKKYRLCLFCWPVPSRNYGPGHKEYIEFPSPNEILFNGQKITENVRGLKNKPGTAKPADLTAYIRPPPQINTLDLIYAYTRNDFQMACYVTEIISPDELLKSIVLKHPRISKKTTLDYIKKTMSEEDEDDLITTSTVLSLQCPISYTRMKYPAQSRRCKHLQCFDALWYLHSQMQVPTWQCPVCSISIPLENLVISEYVDEIIKSADEEVEQVELSPDGSWKAFIEEETPAPNHGNSNTGHSSPVKQEHSNESMSNIPNGEHADAVVISLDSSDDEDNMVTANESPEMPTAASSNVAVTDTHTGLTTAARNINEHGENTEADLPLSRYIRRNSTNTVNTPVPTLETGSLLGLGINPQPPMVIGSLPTSQQEMLPNGAVMINQHNSLPSLHTNATAQLPVPSNIPPISSSTLFGTTNDIRPPPSVNSSNSNNSILGIGGNLPSLNLPQNDQPPVNPFISTNSGNLNNTNVNPLIANANSTSPLPPLTNMFRSDGASSTNTTDRPIAVPHSRNHSSRRSRNEASPFIPRKHYPPTKVTTIPRKRTEVGSNEPMNRGGTHLPDNTSSTARINPITNRPYQENGNVHDNVNPPVILNPFIPPVLNPSENNNSNESDIIDLTSD